jgi:hypothetical protein
VDTLLSIALGVALAAACGFRVFVPLLVLGVSARLGFVELAPSFAWLSGSSSLLALACATVIEIAAYYIPWIDNLLDHAAGPLAATAGVFVSASVFTGLDPVTKWMLAVIAGGGAAGTVQALTMGLRALSSVTTLGLANPIVATVELFSAAVVSLVAIVLPLFALAFVVGLVVLVGLVARRPRRAAG